MPLNALQRETLYDTIISYVDTVLEQPLLAHSIKINWLKAVINDALPSLSQALEMLRQNPNLILGLARAVNVPQAIREDWAVLIEGYINGNPNQPPPAELLERLKIMNNYNPVLMAEMKRFRDAIVAVPELNSIKRELSCLREVYLEMTPLLRYSYGESYLAFRFRIGSVPLNLDQCGPTPVKGEIQADIVRLIEDRIEQAEKYQKILAEQECQRKAQENAAASATLREQDLSFAVNLFLNDITEEQRREQFKRVVASTLETPSPLLNQPISLSALLLKKRPSHVPENQMPEQLLESKGERERIPEVPCMLYLGSQANLDAFVTAGIQKTIVLCFNNMAASSSSGARSCHAYFIEQGQWVTESNEKIKVEMGELNLSAFEEGLLKENAETLALIEQAERKRNQLSQRSFVTVSPSVPQPVSNRRFLQMQAALSNRITQTLSMVKAKLDELGTTIKQSPEYLELRKVEFSKVLLEVQRSVVSACLTNTVDWNAINQTYQEQLTLTYNMYIQDMYVKCMSNRVTHLNDAQLKAVAEQFTGVIDNAMRDEMKNFRALELNPTHIRQVENQLLQKKDRLDTTVQRLKEQWDRALEPLASLANQCGILRELRAKIQNQGIDAWHSVLQELYDMAKHTFQEAPNTIDAEGFSLLHYACWSGHIDLVKGLIAQGESIFGRSQEGYSVLHFAAENTHAAIIPLLEFLLISAQAGLLSLKTKRDKIPLHIAASKGNLPAVIWLLQKLPNTVNDGDKHGVTPLHEAARHGHSDTVQHLLMLGANGRVLDQQKNTPIVLAVLEGHIETAQVFFDNGIWLDKQETMRCLKTIERHPNPQTIIDSIAIPFADTVEMLSQLNRRVIGETPQRQTESAAAEQASSPRYLPLFESTPIQPVNMHVSLQPAVSELGESPHF